MNKLRSKFTLIGILSILVVALLVGLALPALAASPNGGTRGTGTLPSNFASIQGALAVMGNVITVTPSAAPSVALTVTSGQLVTILYNNSTGAVQGLMLNKSGQTLPTPKKQTNSSFANVQGTLAVAGNIITVTPNAATSVALNAAAGQMAAILYNKTTGAVQGLRLSRSGQPSATPKVVPNKNFANVQGTLALSGNVITVTANSAPTVALNAAAGQMVTILYNNSTGAVQGLMLNRTGQALSTSKVTPNATPRAMPNNNFASVQGTLTVAGNVIAVTPSATPSVALTVTAGQLVTILYNNSTGAVQGLMSNKSGQTLPTPKNRTNKNFANVQGILAIANNIITITPSATPSIALTVTSGQLVTILYNNTTGAVQGLMLNKSGQTLPMPKNQTNSSFANVQGTLAVTGNVITVTPSATPSIALTVTTGQKVNILYNNSTGAIQGLMSNRLGQTLFTPKNLPNQNGQNWNGHGRFGQSGSAGHQGMSQQGTRMAS